MHDTLMNSQVKKHCCPLLQQYWNQGRRDSKSMLTIDAKIESGSFSVRFVPLIWANPTDVNMFPPAPKSTAWARYTCLVKPPMAAHSENVTQLRLVALDMPSSIARSISTAPTPDVTVRCTKIFDDSLESDLNFHSGNLSSL